MLANRSEERVMPLPRQPVEETAAGPGPSWKSLYKGVAYLGIATCAAAFIALSLWPIAGVNYLWWWIFNFVWFIAVGWKLYQLGKK